MPRRTSTPAPGARSPGCRRSHDPWRKGGGIFRTPAVIAERVPAPLPMFGVWVLGGLLALCGALTYAELAALFPRSGGVYVYIREGFGRLPAFLFGWTELVLIRAS